MSIKTTSQSKTTVSQRQRDYDLEIVSLLQSNQSPKHIKEHILAYHENYIASAMEEMTYEERRKLYNILGMELLAPILEYCEKSSEYLDELTFKRKLTILPLLEPTTVSKYLDSLDKDQRQNLIELLDDETKEEISLFDSFEDDEIGSRMSTNYVSIQANTTIRGAMKELVSQAAENDNISTIYVTEEDGTFVGAINLKDLIIARDTTELSSVLLTSYPYLYAYELIENTIERIKEYSEDSIPVLDADNKLQGVLISQDVIELVADEMNDDYAKLAGLSSEEDLNEPVGKSVAKRLPWLIVLLFLGLVVSAVVGVFEGIVAHIAIIVSFQSLILGMSGNVGTQSLAVTIRVLMDEQLTTKQKIRFALKESRIGLLNGVILGILSFGLVGFYLVFFKSQAPQFAFSVSSCTALSLMVAVFLSSIAGTMIPMVFKKLKIDPAVASGPLITTVNDLVAVISYYGISWLLLINLLNY